jgi:hypothetical protein
MREPCVVLVSLSFFDSVNRNLRESPVGEIMGWVYVVVFIVTWGWRNSDHTAEAQVVELIGVLVKAVLLKRKDASEPSEGAIMYRRMLQLSPCHV